MVNVGKYASPHGCYGDEKPVDELIWYCWWKKSCTGWLIVYPCLSQYLQGLLHSRWLFGIPSINSSNKFTCDNLWHTPLITQDFFWHSQNPPVLAFCDITTSQGQHRTDSLLTWKFMVTWDLWTSRLRAVKEHNSGHHFQIGKLPPQKNTKWNSHLWCLSLFIISVGSFGSKQGEQKSNLNQTWTNNLRPESLVSYQYFARTLSNTTRMRCVQVFQNRIILATSVLRHIQVAHFSPQKHLGIWRATQSCRKTPWTCEEGPKWTRKNWTHWGGQRWS